MILALLINTGHLIFEMSTGQECSTATPEPHDLSTIRHSAVVEVSIVEFEQQVSSYKNHIQIMIVISRRGGNPAYWENKCLVLNECLPINVLPHLPSSGRNWHKIVTPQWAVRLNCSLSTQVVIFYTMPRCN